MAMMAAMLRVDGGRMVQGFEEAAQKLETADGELVLDFSSVVRLDPRAVTALKTLAGMAEEKAVKLVKLSNHFSFAN
jgi:anti-anti-sigma regulatory factor